MKETYLIYLIQITLFIIFLIIYYIKFGSDSFVVGLALLVGYLCCFLTNLIKGVENEN